MDTSNGNGEPAGMPDEQKEPTPATPPTPSEPAEPAAEPEAVAEETTDDGVGDSTTTDPKGGVKAWVWVLIGVGALLVVGGGVALAFVLLQPKSQPVPVEVNTTSNEQSNTIGNDTSEPTRSSTVQDLDEYIDDARSISDALVQAYDRWSAAAEYGADGDFENSTAELRSGLELVEAAENLYDVLEPPAAARTLDDLLSRALGLARRAMEQGILGNESEDDVDAITRSGEAIESMITTLDEIDAELQDLSSGQSSAV